MGIVKLDLESLGMYGTKNPLTRDLELCVQVCTAAEEDPDWLFLNTVESSCL